MKRFLSIDWDFFIEATATQRYMLFPDGGNENLHTTLRKYIWDSRYSNPELSEIKVSSYYSTLVGICRAFHGYCFVADSHRFIYDFIMENTKPNEEFEVYNIDFHHDLYDYRTDDERVNCGNWATILREDRPNMKYMWVKRDDSDLMTVGDVEVDVETMDMEHFVSIFNDVGAKSFNFLYLCRSAMWSPPHLDPQFIKVAKILIKKCPAIYERGIAKPRPYEIPSDFSEYLALSNIHKGKENEKIDSSD